MPMHKGIVVSVGYLWPSTRPYLTLHSDVIVIGKQNTEKEAGVSES